ncbi:Leucine-rich repeat-containing protein [Cynara cardunculus var. scolymus]|uniref:Leucine-rich repeat-containing protein n=1 Tax=Cynara cardunculus var. scolymus TaxID=59895 RepID=A0A103XBM1_CYNCS|nr:Leucine-rich repeat-containing protein [Cynara cardunculus var. scolymus]
MPYLKFIHLERLDCLESFPDVSGAPNIERLILKLCGNLVEVHESLGSLRKLAYLRISHCWKLEYLPPLIDMPLLETLDLSHCCNLKNFPKVCSGMEKLSNINLHNCPQLQKLPEELGSMVNLEELRLSFWDHSANQISCFNFHTLPKLFLRKLDLSCRQIEDQKFLNNLHAFSSLEELCLSGNSKLLHLPSSISHLSRLKHLELNECQQLRNIQGLPSGIQILKATDCRVLEEIEDLTEEYKQLAVDRRLSIWIPGSKIPSWFEHQHHGREIALKFPTNRHTNITGFVVCVVFRNEWPFKQTEIEDSTLSIIYIPIGDFWRQMQLYGLKPDDWSPLLEGRCCLNLNVVSSSIRVERCGAHIMYKEDTESVQQITTSISDYRDLEDKHFVDWFFWYRIEFKVMNIDL